jgi:hypothetical protein
MQRALLPGVVYWVEFARTRFKVRVVEQPAELLGWWRCSVDNDGEEIILPEAAFREAAVDGQSGG